MKKLMLALAALGLITLALPSGNLAHATPEPAPLSLQDIQVNPDEEPVDCSKVDCADLLIRIKILYIHKFTLEWQGGFLQALISDLYAELNGVEFQITAKETQISFMETLIPLLEEEAEVICESGPNSQECMDKKLEILYWETELERARAELAALESQKAAIKAQIAHLEAQLSAILFTLTIEVQVELDYLIGIYNTCCDPLTEDEVEAELQDILVVVLAGLLETWAPFIFGDGK